MRLQAASSESFTNVMILRLHETEERSFVTQVVWLISFHPVIFSITGIFTVI